MSAMLRTFYKLKEHVREQPSAMKAQNSVTVHAFAFHFYPLPRVAASSASCVLCGGSEKLHPTVSSRLSKTLSM